MTTPTLDQLVREYLDACEVERAAFDHDSEAWFLSNDRLLAADKALQEHGRRALLSTPSAKLVEACRDVLAELQDIYDGTGKEWTREHITTLTQALADYDQEQLNPYNPAAQQSVTQPGDIEHHQRGLTNPQE